MLMDGSQPVGRGIGPALEAREVISILRNSPDASQDLRTRALTLASKVLEMGGSVPEGAGFAEAESILSSGKALEKFYQICMAQGGFSEPVVSRYQREYRSLFSGTVVSIDNRKLALAAKLAGAPQDKGAGIYLSAHLGDKFGQGQSLFTVFAESEGALRYVFEYLEKHPDIIHIENSVL